MALPIGAKYCDKIDIMIPSLHKTLDDAVIVLLIYCGFNTKLLPSARHHCIQWYSAAQLYKNTTVAYNQLPPLVYAKHLFHIRPV